MSVSLVTREGVAELLKGRGCNPFLIMADLAIDVSIDPSVRARCASELANYVAPKLKATEIKLTDDRPNAMPVDLSQYKRPPRQLSQVTGELKKELAMANAVTPDIIADPAEYADYDEDGF